MNLGDVFAFFGTLLAIGLAWPGLLLAWSLLVPTTVERARHRLERTPWRCFWLGGLLLAVSIPLVVILLKIPAGPVQLAGWLAVFVLLSGASLGAAGLAALLGDRLRGAGLAVSRPGALLRGAVALELAAVFPLIGWFVLIPLAGVCALGAAGFALLHWMPRPVPAPEAVHAGYTP
ncbi:MAG TPA: hypothetical protein VKY74_19025 [Chloroflexia bacterium]|nr:hypothetical protein [Chloroflexia bacterium]